MKYFIPFLVFTCLTGLATAMQYDYNPHSAMVVALGLITGLMGFLTFIAGVVMVVDSTS